MKEMKFFEFSRPFHRSHEHTMRRYFRALKLGRSFSTNSWKPSDIDKVDVTKMRNFCIIAHVDHVRIHEEAYLINIEPLSG